MWSRVPCTASHDVLSTVHYTRGTNNAENFNRRGQDQLPDTCSAALAQRGMAAYAAKVNLAAGVRYKGDPDLGTTDLKLLRRLKVAEQALGLEDPVPHLPFQDTGVQEQFFVQYSAAAAPPSLQAAAPSLQAAAPSLQTVTVPPPAPTAPRNPPEQQVLEWLAAIEGAQPAQFIVIVSYSTALRWLI